MGAGSVWLLTPQVLKGEWLPRSGRDQEADALPIGRRVVDTILMQFRELLQQSLDTCIQARGRSTAQHGMVKTQHFLRLAKRGVQEVRLHLAAEIAMNRAVG